MITVAFFGCWGTSGHFLYNKSKETLSDHKAREAGLPEDQYFDGSQLLLPQPEVPGHGQCTYLPNFNLTVLSWWNRVFDTRGKVNSHFMMRGKFEDRPDLMWAGFEYNFPDIAKHHTKPIIQVFY